MNNELKNLILLCDSIKGKILRFDSENLIAIIDLGKYNSVFKFDKSDKCWR